MEPDGHCQGARLPKARAVPESMPPRRRGRHDSHSPNSHGCFCYLKWLKREIKTNKSGTIVFFLRIQNVEQHVRIFFSGIGYVFAWHDLFVDGSIPQFTDRNGYGMMHRNHPRCLMVQQKTSVDRIYI